MNTTNQIKYLAITELLLFILTVIASYYFESYLDPLLQEYLAYENNIDISNLTLFLYIAILLATLINIISLIGLIFIKSWAKKLYLISTCIMFLSVPFLGPYVDHGITDALDGIASLTTGALLAMLYYTKNAFNKPSNSDAASSSGS